MLRDMLIDVVAKKMMIEGQGEYVTLRRACWTAWPPGSLKKAPHQLCDGASGALKRL